MLVTLFLRLHLLAAMLLIRLSRITNSGAVKVCRKSAKSHPDRHRGFSLSGTSGKSHARAKKIHVDENPDDKAQHKKMKMNTDCAAPTIRDKDQVQVWEQEGKT